MVSARTSMAVVGAPTVGSQSRGLAIMVVPDSYLPQARILPVGSRLMCSGTMLQGTGASHLPVDASVGRELSVTVEERALTLPVEYRSVWEPVPAIPRSTNLARPVDEVVAETLPCRLPEPLAMAA